MKKNRYGQLDNVINSLYQLRKTTTGPDQIAVQKALSLAFDISYQRPVQDHAIKELAAAAYQLAPDTMEVIKALKADAIKYYPLLVNKLNTYLIFS